MATSSTNKAAAAKGAATTGSKTTSAKTTTVSDGKITTPTPSTSSSSNTSAILSGLQGLTTSLGALGGLVSGLGAAGSGNTGTTGYRTDASYVAEGRSGTSNTGQNYIEGKPVSKDEFQKWLYGGTGKTTGTVTTPAIDTTQSQSAYDTLYNEFKQYGLESLVDSIKGLVQQGVTGSTLSLALQNTDAYKKRFAANQDRINAGLSALSPAQYIAMEDQYQNLMRQYGLPESYYAKGELGIQPGFNKLIANDVSATELNDRLIEAQQKVNQSNPEVMQALKQFYPGITNGDILAYSLDPKNALTDIKRKVAAAEIGGSALAQGLATSNTSAEALAAQGVTKAQAQQGYGTIAGYLPTAKQLSDIYNYQGVGPYTQSQAEADVFGGTGSAEATRLRKKLADLEQAQFAGQSGTAGSGALSRDRAITNYQLGLSGSGQF